MPIRTPSSRTERAARRSRNHGHPAQPVSGVLNGLAAALLLVVPGWTAAQRPAEIDERLERLEARQRELEQQLERRDERIDELERALADKTDDSAPVAGSASPASTAESEGTDSAVGSPEPGSDESAEADSGAPVAFGNGVQLAEGRAGTLSLGVYALLRATTQRPADQTAFDHLGRELVVDTRRDVQLHRVMIHLRGWFLDPKFRYHLTTWTVNDTEQVRLIGALGYRFSDNLALWGGVGATPGTRSLGGSHPFWLGHDRVMADEYFRTGFSTGIWLDGKATPTLNYKLMVANNISSLGVNASEDTRDLAYGGSLWWMPTTGEFGPQGGWGDFEQHQEPATRFGFSYMRSPKEDRAAQPSQNAPDTTQIRLGDSLLLFERGALGDGITVQKADFQVLSLDAGFKYKGFFLQAEVYQRLLDTFEPAAGSLPIPVDSIRDEGFYVQGSFFPVPKRLELYAATSRVRPDRDVGYDDSSEVIVGANWFWRGSRYQRLNVQVIDVRDSPASSTFGYYTGGMDGTTVTVDVSMLF